VSRVSLRLLMAHRHTLSLNARPITRPPKKKKAPTTAAVGGVRPEWLQSQGNGPSANTGIRGRQSAKRDAGARRRSVSNKIVPDSEDPIEQFSDPVNARGLRNPVSSVFTDPEAC
jgi:hypothetical protein